MYIYKHYTVSISLVFFLNKNYLKLLPVTVTYFTKLLRGPFNGIVGDSEVLKSK